MGSISLPSLRRMKHCSWITIWRKRMERIDMQLVVQVLVLSMSQMAIGCVSWSTVIVHPIIPLIHLLLVKYYLCVNVSTTIKREVVMDWTLPLPIPHKVLLAVEMQLKKIWINSTNIAWKKEKKEKENLLLFRKWIGLNNHSVTLPLCIMRSLSWLLSVCGRCFPTS